VDSFAFNQVWEDGQTRWRAGRNGDADMYINEYSKIDDANVSDGFKVKNLRDSKIYVGDDVLVAVNDCDNSSQLALRIRTIFKEREDYKKVYVLRFTTKSIKKKFYDEQQFDLVDKDFVYSLRNVEKAKVKGRMGGVSKGGGSTRQNIKLFEFNESRIHNRGAGSAWDDVTETPDDEALYVPIFNYKIVDEESTGNSSVTEEKISLRKLKYIIDALALHDVVTPTIYGVRRKDCSKLDDNFKCAFKWIESKSKEILSDETIYENQALLNSIRERQQWDDFYDFGKVITNEHFMNHVSKDVEMKNHDIVKFHNICKQEQSLMQDVCKYESLIEFIEEQTGKDTYSKKMKAKLNSTELRQIFYSIREKYGMLSEIQFYGYSADRSVLSKITAYIKMCDRLESIEGNFIEKSA
jgi:hypothetical protein